MSAAARGGGGDGAKGRGRGRARGSAGTGFRGRAAATGVGMASSDEVSRIRNAARSLKRATPQNVTASRGRRGVPGTTRRTTSKTLLNSRGRSKGVAETIAHTNNSNTGNLSGVGRGGNIGETASVLQRYQALKNVRDKERAEAIANGFLADPDKPRTLAEAITPVGTCQGMCPEFERVERIVQNDVWGPETATVSYALSTSGPGMFSRDPDEKRMVKKFRRAAAGIDEQLPSDLRPPVVLKKTLDYLFNDVISNAESLSQVHHFVWDRTRAIRNDFSIQQITKIPELKIAIKCYECIARFHILSLHMLASPQNPYDKYDAQQEKEQLDKTLLSLMQYYDDSRGRLDSPNEAEFRAYCIIFQIQDPVPNLEDRLQTWPKRVIDNERVLRALKIYAAACSITDNQGPLKPRASHPIAQANWRRFWNLISSNEVSYLMACVAETYFNFVRRTALNLIWQACRQGNRRTEDWTIDELVEALGMDDEQQVQTYCEAFGFSIEEKEDGTQFLDLSSVQGTALPEPVPGSQKQIFSELVEQKRHGRTIPAVISGMSVHVATDSGLIDSDYRSANEMDHEMSDAEDNSLFITGDSDEEDPNTKAPNGVTLNPALASTSISANFSPDDSSSLREENSNSFSGQQTPELVESASRSGLFAANPPPPEPRKPLIPSTSSGDEEQTAQDSIHSNESKLSPNRAPILNPSKSSPQISDMDHLSNPPSGTGTSFSFFASQGPQNKWTGISHTDVVSKASNESNSFATSSSPGISLYFRPSGASGSTSANERDFEKDQKSNHPLQDSLSLAIKPNQSTAQSQEKYTNSCTGAFSSPSPLASNSQNLSLKEIQSLHQPSRPSPLSQPPQQAESELSVQNLKTYALDALSSRKAPSELQSSDIPTSTYSTGSFADKDSNYSDLLDCVARILVIEPNGFLDQFLDYTIIDIIRKTRTQIQDEKYRAKADCFRRQKLQIKYARRWRHICWSRHLQQSGRERRRRLARYREIRNSLSPSRSISGQIHGLHQSRTRSPTLRPDISTGLQNHLSPDPRASGVTTLSTQIIKPDMPPPPVPSPAIKAHRRAESLPDTQNIIRPKYPSPLTSKGSNMRDSLLSSRNRSSPTYISRHSSDSTKSTYFKLKAKGLNPLDPVFSQETSGRKRSRSSADSEYSSIPEKRPITSSSDLNHTDLQTKQGVSKSNHKQAKEDDDLLQRVRRAREAMSDSIDFFKEEIAKDEEHRLSQSLRSSPASSIISSITSSRDAPPKYRSRVSKFLPKDQYADVTRRRAASDGMASPGLSPPLVSMSQQQAHVSARHGLTGRPLANGVLTPRTSSQSEVGATPVVTTQLARREIRSLPEAKVTLSSNPFEALASVEDDFDDEDDDNDDESAADDGEDDQYMDIKRKKLIPDYGDDEYIYSEGSSLEDEEVDSADDSGDGEDENGTAVPKPVRSVGNWGGKTGASVEDAIEL